LKLTFDPSSPTPSCHCGSRARFEGDVVEWVSGLRVTLGTAHFAAGVSGRVTTKVKSIRRMDPMVGYLSPCHRQLVGLVELP
jgi:hypothetical protein